MTADKNTTPNFPRKGCLNLNGWEGTTSTLVDVIGETQTKLRIRAIEKTKLAGRARWLQPGETVLVPRYTVTDEPLKKETNQPEYSEDTPQWLRDLHFIANADQPLFEGLLKTDDWKTNEADKDLREWLENNWIELIPGNGFVITETGRNIVIENGLKL